MAILINARRSVWMILGIALIGASGTAWCEAPPADNSVWTLNLDEAAEWGVELQVSVEVRNGTPRSAYATALSARTMLSPVDITGLSYENHTLSGEIKVDYLYQLTHRKKRNYYAVYSIQCASTGEGILGTHTGQFESIAVSGAITGQLIGISPVPNRVQCDMWLDAAFPDEKETRPILQLLLDDGEVKEKSYHNGEIYKQGGKGADFLFRILTGGICAVRGRRHALQELSASLDDTVFSAKFTAESSLKERTAICEYELRGTTVGNRIVGATTVKSEGQTWEGRFFGMFGPPPPEPDPLNGYYTLAVADILPEHINISAETNSGRFGSSIALAPSVNRRWHHADVSGLSISGTQLSGPVSVTFSSDPSISNAAINSCQFTIDAQIDKFGFVSGEYAGSVNGESRTGSIWGQIMPQTGMPYEERIEAAKALYSGTMEIDQECAARAASDYLTPVRSERPGERPFWTSSSLQYMLTGRGVRSDSLLIPYWTTPPNEFLYAPAFEFPPAAGAVRYAYTLESDKGNRITFEDTVSHVSLDEYWDEIPVSVKHLLKVTPYSADNSEINDTVRECTIYKKEPFAGLYVDELGDVKERLLSYFRWLKDQSLFSTWQSDMSTLNAANWEAEDCNGGAEAPSIVRTMLRYSKLADDPHEAAFARSMAIRCGCTILMSSRNDLDFPSTQKNRVTFMQYYPGLAFLELYHETGRKVFSDKAVAIARGLRKVQRPSGSWAHTDINGIMSDGTHSHGGEAIDEFDPSAVLYFLGRLRTELNTSEFVDVEDRAWQWLETHSLHDLWWRYQPEHGLGQRESVRSPKELTFLVRYILDYAPAERRDVGLAEEVARYCEDQFTVWDRSPGPYSTPHVVRAIEKTKRYTPLAERNASVAHMFMRLYHETGNTLYQSKAEALYKSILLLQSPINGGLEADYDCARPGGVRDATIDPRFAPEYLSNYAYPAIYLYDYATNSISGKVPGINPGKTRAKTGLGDISVYGGRLIRITIPADGSTVLNATVFDLRGRSIERRRIDLQNGQNGSIVFGSMSRGSYIVRIQSPKGSLIKRARILY